MRNIIVLFVLLFTCLTAATAAPSLIPAPPRVNANAYLLIDHHSGDILAEKNADDRIEPASLTKLMTAYVALYEIERGGISLEDEVKISEKAWRMGGSRMFIEVNTLVSVKNLLKGLIIQSGNDASVALAEHIASNEASFVELMNQHAERLNMNATHFNNSTGWPDDNHYTTARDLAKLSRALINDFPKHYPAYKEKEFRYNKIRQYNRNRLLWLDDRVDGLKTGHTEAAGYCLISSAKDNNMRLISIVTGTSADDARIAASRKLLNYGFRFFETHLIHKANSEITNIRIWKGDKKQLSLGIANDLYVTTPKGLRDNIKNNIKIEAMIEAPVAEGQTYGKVIINLRDKTIASQNLVALSSIKEGGVWRKLVDNIQLMFQ
ncbi:MAG: D-alanyl-D-alanine carboxypeptidase [Gammaproteobacteria bacterium]|nr:D-alanyl-D-alanine carboxypeptidase [Gammaproteobacteria bacterium]MCW8987317.1 D-alanyl-D-alanine carboxypeptidase [Gammaproteobacteria bacterium]